MTTTIAQDALAVELAEKGLRDSVWMAIYFAQVLHDDAIGMRLLAIRRDLLAVEVTK